MTHPPKIPVAISLSENDTIMLTLKKKIYIFSLIIKYIEKQITSETNYILNEKDKLFKDIKFYFFNLFVFLRVDI